MAAGFLELLANLVLYYFGDYPLSIFLDSDEIVQLYELKEQNPPVVLWAFALWLMTSLVKPKEMTVYGILEQFCGPLNQKTSLHWPDMHSNLEGRHLPEFSTNIIMRSFT